MSEWIVRKVADQLRPGDRFIFADDMGGEGEVLTVESTADSFGTIEIATEEKDFTIEANFNQMITLAPDGEEDDPIDVLIGYSALLPDEEEEE